MMAVVAVGLAFVAVGIGFYALKLRVSYDTEGGAIGMVPVLDGAIFPPLSVALGVSLATRGVPHHGLYALLLYVVLVPLAYGGIAVAAERGRRRQPRGLPAPHD